MVKLAKSCSIKKIYSDDPSVCLPSYFGLPLQVTGINWVRKWNENQQRLAISRAYPVAAKPSNNFVIYAHFFSGIRMALNSYPGIPVMGVLGDSSPWIYDQMYGSSWFKTLLSCRAVVAVSKTAYNFYLNRCPKLKDRLYYVPNGVDLNTFKPQDKLRCRTKLGIEKKVKLAVFVGGFEERKGPLRVLLAARKADYKVAFLGQGRQVPKGPEVLVTRTVGQNELLKWLGAADCFVLPSLAEGRSNAILEAMACGVPVVVSNLPFNTEFVTEKCGALVNPEDPNSIADGLKETCEKKNSLIMRLEARKIAESFSQTIRIKKLEKILKTIIKIK